MTLGLRLGVLVLLAAAPVLLIHIYGDYENREVRKASVVGEARTLAGLVAARQDRTVEGARLLLEASSHLQSIQEKNAEVCSRRLHEIAAKVQELTAIAVLSPGGDRWCVSIESAGNMNLADRKYFQDTVKFGAMQSSDYVIGRQTGQGSLVYTYPAFDGGGRLDSVLFVAYRTSVLSRLLNDPPLPEGAVALLLDSHGVVAARWPEPERTGENLAGSDIARRAISQRQGAVQAVADWAGPGEYAFAFAPLLSPSKLTAVVGLPTAAVLAEADAIFWKEVAWTTLVFLLAAFLAIWGTQLLVMRPLRALHKSVDNLAQGKFNAEDRNAIRGITELRSLGEHFSQMAEALQHRQTLLLEALQQKEILLKEVNHRVKNSLQLVASIFGLQRSRITDPEARRQFDLAGRRINTVAQIHQRLYQDEHVDRVALDKFLQEMCADLQRMLGDEGKVSVSCHAHACYLPTQEVIPVALIANELITNAFKYGYPDGTGGMIRVTCEKEEGAIVLTVSDDGSALPENFEPAASNGLGMKMITSLAKQLRATLDIVRLDPGKAFRLRVPSPEI